MEKALIVNVGNTPEAVVSVILAVLEKTSVDKVVLFPTPATEEIARYLKGILEEELNLEVDVIVLKGYGLEEMVKTYSNVIDELKNKGYHVIVDVTPGRKVMSIAAYTAGVKANAIVYLHLHDERFRGWLLPFIPKPLTELTVLRGSL